MLVLKELQEKHIIQYGEFKLKSGKISNVYIDLRKVMSFPSLHKQICHEIINKINLDVDLICGTPYGAVSYSSYISIFRNIPMIFLRKEAKTHGTKKMIEGNYELNNRVILLEDVTTTGSSVFNAIDVLEQHGLKVVQIITIISRHVNKQLYYNNKPIEYLYHIDDIENEKLFNEKSLQTIISEKKTKICLAADVYNMDELCNLIEKVGDDICILKLHSDIIDDFYVNYKKNVSTLIKLKHQYNFKIWEDRKFADIGSVMIRQISLLSNWVDIVSIHPISGSLGIENIKNMELIIIAEMSTKEHLMNEEYQKNAIQLAENNNVLGVVSQHKVSDKLMHFVPGISLKDTNDKHGQTYNSPENKDFADVFVIGRGIYLASDPKEEIMKYKKLL